MSDHRGLIVKGNTALFLRGDDPGATAASSIAARYRLGDETVVSEFGLELVSRPDDLSTLAWKHGFFTVFNRKLKLPAGPFDPELTAVVESMKQEAAGNQAMLESQKNLGPVSPEARELLGLLADNWKLSIKAGVWRLEKPGTDAESVICPGGISAIDEIFALGLVDPLNNLTAAGRAAISQPS